MVCAWRKPILCALRRERRSSYECRTDCRRYRDPARRHCQHGCAAHLAGTERAWHQRILPDRGRRQSGSPAPCGRNGARPRGHHHHHRRPRPHARRPDKGNASLGLREKDGVAPALARPHQGLFPDHWPRDDAEQRKTGLAARGLHRVRQRMGDRPGLRVRGVWQACHHAARPPARVQPHVEGMRDAVPVQVRGRLHRLAQHPRVRPG